MYLFYTFKFIKFSIFFSRKSNEEERKKTMKKKKRNLTKIFLIKLFY